MSEERYDRFRTWINPFLRKRFGVELFKAYSDGVWVGIGIRKWLK